MKFLNKKERGEYGYLKYRKTVLTIGLIGVIAASVLIFVVGLLLNKGETANLFTIVSILGVLPGAKFLVLLIVVFPHKSMKEEEKTFLDSLLKANDRIFYDVVFTSKERPMHLDAIIVTGHQIIGYTTSEKDKLDKIESYFKNELGIRNIDFVCFLTASDKTLASRFKMRGDGEEISEKQAKDRETVTDFIRTAIV